MLSLKKKSEAAAVPQVPAWHPNFRNYEKLPDIKVIRTAFFINGGAIFVALALLTYLGIHEWQLHALHNQIAFRQRDIDRDKKDSDRDVALFKKFQTEEARLAEVDAFVKSKPSVSELLVHLAQTLPGGIAIDSLDLRDAGLTMRFSVRGTPDVASGLATAYRDQLAADPQMARFDEVRFTSTPTKNPATGRIIVEFFLHLKGAKK
jgi:hypothetical protein